MLYFSISSVQEKRSRIHNMSVSGDAVHRRTQQSSGFTQTGGHRAYAQPWSMYDIYILIML